MNYKCWIDNGLFTTYSRSLAYRMECSLDRFTGMAVFVAAVEDGSLAAAARRFDLSPAMAGKHISAMEADLNARLLQRTTRKLNLTEVGQSYYRRCKRILDDYDEANREAREVYGTERGLLKIAAPVTFGSMHLGAVVARYLKQYPNVSVEIALSDQFVDLIDAGVDLAVRIGRLPDSDLISKRLAPCRMVACASPAYLERFGAPTLPSELETRKLLLFSDVVTTNLSFIDASERTHMVEGHARLFANNMEILLSATLAGIGISYGPTFVFGSHLERGDLVAVLADYRTPELGIHAVYPTARHVSLKARRFIDLLTTVFTADPPWDRWKSISGHQPA